MFAIELRNRTLTAAVLALALAATMLLVLPPSSSRAEEGFAACDVGDEVVTDVMDAGDWDPVRPHLWEFPGDEVILAQAGTGRPGPRRPFEYAVLTAGPTWRSFELDAEVRIDVATPIGRDVIVFFGWQSDQEFYYAHLSEDTRNYVHNGIFKVASADRERIDDQWDGSVSAPAAITDTDWNRVRVRHCVETGEIAVFMGDDTEPLMTATDTTFDHGRVAFGSFDDIGRIRDLTVTGTALACPEHDRRETVVVGGIDTGVENRRGADGCTINDLVRDEDEWGDHGAFVSHVAHVTSALRDGGLLDGRERGAIVSAAARSGVGR